MTEPKIKKHIILKKEPKQRRSSVTFNAIIDAAIKIIGSNPKLLTTNRIAEIAGVNIASLYQYFPNKDSILSSVLEKMMSKNQELIKNFLNENKDLPIELKLDELVKILTTMKVIKPKLFRVLASKIFEFDKIQVLKENDRNVIQIIKNGIAHQFTSPSLEEDLQLMIFILRNSIVSYHLYEDDPDLDDLINKLSGIGRQLILKN